MSDDRLRETTRAPRGLPPVVRRSPSGRPVMSPDDPRHGTRPGVSAHHAAQTPLCDPCREARNAYERDRYRGVGKRFVNYTESGYDPADGLDEDAGRWMYDDERHCQVWVETGRVA